jgi:hypothetical protein
LYDFLKPSQQEETTRQETKVKISKEIQKALLGCGMRNMERKIMQRIFMEISQRVTMLTIPKKSGDNAQTTLGDIRMAFTSVKRKVARAGGVLQEPIQCIRNVSPQFISVRLIIIMFHEPAQRIRYGFP